MSEESLAKLVCKLSDLRRQSPGTGEHYACAAMLDARLAKAEAAERAVQALVVWMHDSTTANWEPVVEALQEHADQGRVVRKLEEAT